MAALDDVEPVYVPSPIEKVQNVSVSPSHVILPFPESFAAFSAALKSSKEFLLAGVLENQCSCEEWTQNAITLRADPAADAIIKQRLRVALERFEGGERVRLDVIITDDGEILSEAEKQRACYAKAEQAILNSSDMRRIKQIFPQVKITDIKVP